jgi:predicted nuclease of predicted toxin-antitoxin system
MRLIENGDSSLPRNEAAVRPNLSFKLCRSLTDLFPGSSQVRLVGLADATDRAVWDYAKANGFTLVSLDSDFADMAAFLGPPPKVIWLRCGNQPTAVLEDLLRSHSVARFQFRPG